MNLQTEYPTTADEFLRWNEGREGKREFVHGRAVEMTINVTRNHWRRASRLTQQLVAGLGLKDYDIGSGHFGARPPAGRGGGGGPAGRDRPPPPPLPVAEILSPTAMADDFGPKAADYFSLASLRHYLVLARDEVRVWLWTRGDDGGWAGAKMADASQTALDLEHLGISLDLADLSSGIARH